MTSSLKYAGGTNVFASSKDGNSTSPKISGEKGSSKKSNSKVSLGANGSWEGMPFSS